MPTAERGARPDIIVILIDDLRFDETGASGHPYLKTPHIDRLAREGARFVNAFHTTPLCSPNRASILTGQYASRHGIIDNVGRDAMSHRLPNYHVELQKLGYETAHIGKWHMGNDASPRPGYDHWISFRGQGKIVDPVLWEEGREHVVEGTYVDAAAAPRRAGTKEIRGVLAQRDRLLRRPRRGQLTRQRGLAVGKPGHGRVTRVGVVHRIVG